MLWVGTSDLELFLLVFARIAGFLATAPFFALGGVPVLVRGALSLLLAAVLYPVIEVSSATVPESAAAYVVTAAGEVLVGLALGFMASLVLNAFRVAGELIDLHVGFSMVQLFDPQTVSRESPLGRYLFWWSLVIFLLINGHHYLIGALKQSFDLVPVGGGRYDALLIQHAVRVFGGMFALAVKLALPVIAVLLIADAALALVSRTVPQLNVFLMGFPLKAALGLLILSIVAPLVALAVGEGVDYLQGALYAAMRLLG